MCVFVFLCVCICVRVFVCACVRVCVIVSIQCVSNDCLGSIKKQIILLLHSVLNQNYSQFSTRVYLTLKGAIMNSPMSCLVVDIRVFIQ
jgi:hypothetical protein